MEQTSLFAVAPPQTKVQILELFGGIGAPRAALKNLLPQNVKSIDYIEIDQSCVDSYNAMFPPEGYNPQDVRGYNLRPDILFHGSPCQSFSVAGHQGSATKEGGRINRGAGGDKGSGTKSSLMWETCHIIEQMGDWKPLVVCWENVENLLSVYMRHCWEQYCEYMEGLGYTNSMEVLDARHFGVPQSRRRTFTISMLGGKKFDFSLLRKTPMQNIQNYLEDIPLKDVPSHYMVTQPSILAAIGKGNGEIRRATIIRDYCGTITTRQDRTPTNVIDLGEGKYRYLTERECWRLMGYTDAQFDAARKACPAPEGKMNRTLYRQAGNSIPVPICESIFEVLFSEYGIGRNEV